MEREEGSVVRPAGSAVTDFKGETEGRKRGVKRNFCRSVGRQSVVHMQGVTDTLCTTQQESESLEITFDKELSF